MPELAAFEKTILVELCGPWGRIDAKAFYEYHRRLWAKALAPAHKALTVKSQEALDGRGVT